MKLVSNLKKSLKFKKILFYCISVFCFLYIFCVPSFSESSFIIRFTTVYSTLFFLGTSSFLYCFLYDDLRLNKVAFFIPLFAIFAIVGTIFYSKDFVSWFSLLLLSISFFVFIYTFRAIKNKDFILSIIALAFFAFSIYFIVYFKDEILAFSSFDNESFRLGPPFDNQNGVAAYAIVGVATALYLVLFSKKKSRFLFILPILTSLLVGISTGSRTFLLALIVFVAVFLFFKFQKHKITYLIVLIALIGLSVVLLNLPFMETMKDRVIRALGTIFGFGTRVDTSTIERTIMIDYGFTLGSKNAIFGFGVNGFSIVSGIDTYAHSNYAEVLCDFGIIGLLLFYTPLFVFFIKCFTDKKVDKSLVIPFVIYYVIVSISNVIFYKKIYFLILAFLFYLVFCDGRVYKKIPLVSCVKKVVFVCDTMDSGGAEKVISTLANQMSLQDIKVNIIGVADTKPAHSFYQLNRGVDYINFSSFGGKRVKPLKRVKILRNKIKELSPDVVISFLPNANIYTALSLIGTSIPHIVSERNNPYLDPKERIVRVLKKFSFRLSDGCVFQTKDARDYYSKKIQFKSVVIKNPISVNCSVKLNPLKRDNVVLAVGRLVKQKNYHCLLDAFKIFNNNKSKMFKLKIYGDGPMKEEMVRYCDLIRLSDYVIFMGNDSNWQEKEFNDSLYVLSSDYEGMPNSLAEAMAIGIPSISTDCPTGGSRELIKDGFNGMLVPVNNPNILSQKMLEMIKEPSQKYFDNTRDMLIDYSSENITKTWIKYIKGLKREIYE